MTRMVMALGLIASTTACTGQFAKNERGYKAPTPVVTEPATPGVTLSGYARIGVSTGG